MKLGFLGGAFNPPTVAHYNLIKQALEEYDFDMVYFVPMNDYYEKVGLIDMDRRIDMLELVCKNDSKIEVCDIEKEMEFESTAIDAFRLICDRFSGNEIVFFMGEDNFFKMKDWKNYEELMKFNYIVFQRDDRKVLDINLQNVVYMRNSENLNISSTIIRDKLQKSESIDDLVTGDVKDYILRNNLYC